MAIKNFIKRFIEMTQHKQVIAIPQTVASNRLLEGKTALIIGGTSGIGRSIAQEFTKNGCDTIVAGRNAGKNIKGGGGKNLIIDLTNPLAFEENVKSAVSLAQSGFIDILVNCAGVRAEKPLFKYEASDFDKIYQVNIRGIYLFSQAMGKYMIENNIKGHILNLSSSSALRPAQTPYQISKWAIRGMTLGLADAFFPYGIIVNAIAPGPTATPMLGIDETGDIGQSSFYLGRYELPHEIAQLAVFIIIAQEDSHFYKWEMNCAKLSEVCYNSFC